jgi:hypothetical protein
VSTLSPKETLHARERAYERYDGLELTHEDILEIRKRIDRLIRNTLNEEEKETAHVLEINAWFPPTVTAAVFFKHTWLPVVYSSWIRVVLTILPKRKLPQQFRTKGESNVNN